MTTTDLIAAEAIEQDQDVIRLNDRVYRLDQVVTVSSLSLTPGPRVQKIASERTAWQLVLRAVRSSIKKKMIRCFYMCSETRSGIAINPSLKDDEEEDR